MLYSAIIKDKESKRRIVIREQEYPNKSEFIHDLRHNGYAVNPLKVKNLKFLIISWNIQIVYHGIGRRIIEK